MKTIAIHLRLETASHRKRMMGIFRHVGASNAWDVRIIPNEDILCKQLLTENPDERPDGIISGIPYSKQALSAISASGIPFVGIGMTESELSARSSKCGFVLNDNEGIGRSAAEYFLSLGDFRSYAFVSDTRGRNWSLLRGESFAAALKSAGRCCITYRSSEQDAATLSEFLAKLPKPAAIFAAWDGRGADVIHAAHKARLQVPDDVSILGVDDDDLICEHTVPTLTSIRTDAEGMGEHAARMLDALVNGNARNHPRNIKCPILGITERGSTHPTSPASSLIKRAVSFISSEAVNGITPDDVARHLKISRRLLDLRFKQYESRSVAESITDRKLESVKQLLANSEVQIKDAFRRSGFGNVAYATKLFRETFGITPENWRREQRAAMSGAAASAPRRSGQLERLSDISNADAASLLELSMQLSDESAFDVESLRRSMQRGTTSIFVMRHKARIIASVSVACFATPTGNHCRIEDVVVDERHRGKGLGRKLMTKAIEALRAMNVKHVELTSRPSRTVANELYRSLGFKLRKTNVYGFELKDA
ncbi:MAG: GNAT family N-acetyltransferase [Kiritimatiellae bacterium]|nr:GNAT family N-acetyltransferase [Kiritimatiellia bacterium]